MPVLALAALVGSAVTAYVIGYAYVAPAGSPIRSKRGVWLLVFLGLSFLFLPPQLTGLDAADEIMAGVPGASALPSVSWPASIDRSTYLTVWLLTSVIALLAGLRIWKAGKPEWRAGASAYDSSAASRAIGLLPMAVTLKDALDTLGRAGLKSRDLDRVGSAVRDTGKRFSQELPVREADVYALVAAHVSVDVAGPMTGLLLEGAGRRGGSQ